MPARVSRPKSFRAFTHFSQLPPSASRLHAAVDRAEKEDVTPATITAQSTDTSVQRSAPS